MTDYTNLIKDLRYDDGEGVQTLGAIMCSAADVIEALQVENERLSAGWQKANQEALQTRPIVQKQAKDIVRLCDDLKYIAGIARRAGVSVDGDNLEVRAAILGAVQILEAERDALRSKLEEMRRQEPVGFVAPHELKTLREGYPATVVMLPSNKRTEPIYASPKASEPLTNAQCNGGNCSAFNGRSHSPECIADHNECVGGFGNKHPEFRYAGYKNAPLKAGASKEQIAAYEEGKKAAHGIGSQQ